MKEAHAAAGHEFNLGSPKQLQEVLFGELALPRTKKTKTGYTTDADALAWLAYQTDNELPVIMLRHREQAKLRVTVEGLIKTIASDGRIHTTFNQTVAATGFTVPHGPQPPEHPGPHGRGPRHPPRLRGRRGLRVAAHRRLQPDRAARDGAPLRGRLPHRGVHLRRGPAHHGRRPGVLRRPVRGGRGDAPQDQGDVVRPGLRAVRLRPLPAAEHRGGGGARPDGRLLRAVRRRARLSAPRRGRGPGDGIHGDPLRPPPLPARPQQRQPPAARGRRSGWR